MIQLESFYNARHELKELTEANSKEADWTDIPLDVDWGLYKKAEEAGIMFCFMARSDKINGYVNFTIQADHHRRGMVCCTIDVVYVRPDARGGLLGLKLLRKVEEFAEKNCGKGVVMVFNAQKVDVSPLAKRLGYEQSEIIYRKVL